MPELSAPLWEARAQLNKVRRYLASLDEAEAIRNQRDTRWGELTSSVDYAMTVLAQIANAMDSGNDKPVDDGA